MGGVRDALPFCIRRLEKIVPARRTLGRSTLHTEGHSGRWGYGFQSYDVRGAACGGRLRVGRHGEGEPPAAHTLTPTLLPTTCVVVNKLVGLTLSDNRGCAPPVRKCLPPTAKSPQEGSAPRTASQTHLSRLRREEASSCAVRQQCVTHSSPQRGTVSIPASPGCCPALHRAPRSGTSLRRFRGTRERLSDGRAKPDCRKVF